MNKKYWKGRVKLLETIVKDLERQAHSTLARQGRLETNMRWFEDRIVVMENAAVNHGWFEEGERDGTE